jgi:hypothetical protein
MALPLLNDSPQYELKIPSTGKKVKYRPYLVKEEKILLLAAETKDIKEITNAVLNTVSACTYDKINRKELTTFDIEYMFLQIRAKSVGENIKLNITCEECEHVNEHEVNVDQIECKVEKGSNIIALSDKISVEMQYPSYEMMDFSMEDATEAGFAILAKCMKAVISDDERIDMSEESDESIQNFINSMTQKQFDAVSSFLQNMPSVKHDIDFVCNSCGHKNNILLEGMQSFF